MDNKQLNHRISFIIPVLNGEKFIADCIDHILAEMGDDDELIVVDNGSTDGTMDIVRRYSRVTVMQFPHSTIAYLRNRGTEVGSRELLAFIDSDCILCEGWRRAVASVLEDDTIHATGSKYDIPEPAHWIERAWYSKRTREMAPAKYINSGNLVVRREVFEAIGGFDESLVTDEDYDIGRRLNQSGFRIIEAPQIRVIHLGNPKSLRNFYRKEKWHATSSLNALTRGDIDKPTMMTMVFLLCCLIALLILPSIIAGKLSPVRLVALLLFVPLVTAFYRAVQYRAFVHIPAFIVLYFLFYIARGGTFLQYMYRLIMGRIYLGKSREQSR
ncbi:MAG: glycosyltransferase [Candidatus Zixiibacteriota bacterium]|nr:MAG: glycosyltransferase [candidate division Zixibacteria bacterium]